MAMVLGNTAIDRLSTQGQRPSFLVSVPPVPTRVPGTEQDSGFIGRIIKCLISINTFSVLLGSDSTQHSKHSGLSYKI